jgi:hypothetical protein
MCVRPCKKIVFGQETSMVLEMRLHSHRVSFPRACSAAPAQMRGAAAKRGGLGHLPAKPSGRFGPVIWKRVFKSKCSGDGHVFWNTVSGSSSFQLISATVAPRTIQHCLGVREACPADVLGRHSLETQATVSQDDLSLVSRKSLSSILKTLFCCNF